MTIRLLIFFMIVLYPGCRESTKNNSSIIPEKINKAFSLMDKIVELEYITLNESQLINDAILHLIVLDSQFIVNTYGRNKLYRINEDGNVNSEPLKYSEEIPKRIGIDGSIFSIGFNAENKMAYVSDQGMNIFEVDIKNWHVTGLMRNVFGHNMYYYNHKLLLNNFDGNHTIQVLDPNTNEFISNIVKRYDHSGLVVGGSPFVELKDELLFIQSKSDTIYSIKNDQVTPKYSIQNGVGDLANKEKDINQIVLNHIMKKPMPDQDYNILIPTGINSKLCNYLIVSLYGDTRQLWVDMNTNISNIVVPENIRFGHLLFLSSVPQILSYFNGYYYSSTFFDSDFKDNAIKYLESTTVENQPYQSIKDIMEQYKDWDYLENPMIVKFKIKDEFAI